MIEGLLGKTVLYRIAEFDLATIASLPGPNNSVREGDLFPMIVTRVSDDGEVNGTLCLDGTDTLWLTSRRRGTGPGKFQELVKLRDMVFG